LYNTAGVETWGRSQFTEAVEQFDKLAQLKSLSYPSCRVYNDMPEANHVSRTDRVAAILYLQFMAHLSV